MSRKTVVIVGAGPAGLTAAHELLRHDGFRVIVVEQSQEVGGISKTLEYKGNRIDFGGHRFFSKSKRVMDWWLDHLPLQGGKAGEASLRYQGQGLAMDLSGQGPDPETEERVMLVRPRRSRIYYQGKLFDYPLRLSLNTLRRLGAGQSFAVALSYLRSAVSPIRPEANLEHFLINRFGRRLYETFFKEYTEKVWGVSCRDISAEWGAQRIKGLSIIKAAAHALRGLLPGPLAARLGAPETSLIEQFLYPKLGPGQMWEVVAEKVCALGGDIRLGVQAAGLCREGKTITGLRVRQEAEGTEALISADYVISTMPVKELVAGLDCPAPEEVARIAQALPYRDFMTVGVLARRMIPRAGQKEAPLGLLPDSWLYIQEPGVKVGRIQLFNNWSQAMVARPDTVWLGMEYFCSEGDALWSSSNEAMGRFAVEELVRLGLVAAEDVLDAHVLRMPKAYPAYFGAYEEFDSVRRFLDGFENLFLIGRNGMHRYNNQDHSMLTAMVAAEEIARGSNRKERIWAVNTEPEYHETQPPGSEEI